MAYIGNGPDSIRQGRRAVYEFTATANQTAFSGVDDNGITLDLLQASENDVYLNGARLIITDDYTISGDVLTLGTGAASGDKLIVVTQDEVVNLGTYTKDQADSRFLNVSGDVASGDISLGDNNKINFGAGSDLQIYHDTLNSYIDDAGTGSIFIRSGTTYVQNAAGTKTSIATNAGAGQTLYFNNTSKFQTTDNGALVGDGLGTEVLTILANSSGESQLRFADGTTGTAAYQGRVEYDHANGLLNLGAGGTTPFTITSDGKVGIGTNNPAQNLTVYNATASNFEVRSSNKFVGLNASSGYRPELWWQQGQDLGFGTATNGAGSGYDNKMLISSAGNVGIGNTDPDRPLTITANSGANALALRARSNDDYAFIQFWNNAGNTLRGQIYNHNDNIGFTTGTDSSAGYDLYLKDGGNVGIGTSSPGYKLQVDHGTTAQYASSIRNTADNLQLLLGTTTGGLLNIQGKTISSNAAYQIALQAEGGNVGIGTTTPDGKLTVALQNSNTPAFRLSSPTSSNDFAISSYNDSNGTYVALGVNYLFNSSGNDALMDTNKKSAGIVLDGRNNGRIQFLTNSSGTATPRMTISQAGYVGIGRNDPQAMLHIENNTGADTPADGMIKFDNNRGGDWNVIVENNGHGYGVDVRGMSSTGLMIYGRSGGVNTFRVLGNGNVTNTNNSYGAISDLKLKENIIDATSQWEDIKALRIRKYSFKTDNLDQPNQLGVIAQELETAGMGGLVNTVQDVDIDVAGKPLLDTYTKDVKYSVLYMKAVKALQEAMYKIETLQTEMASVKSRLESLEG